MATKSVSFFTVVALGIKLSEAGLLIGQTKLKWHLGQVGPKKFSKFSNETIFFTLFNFLVLLGPSATQVLSVPSKDWPQEPGDPKYILSHPL